VPGGTPLKANDSLRPSGIDVTALPDTSSIRPAGGPPAAALFLIHLHVHPLARVVMAPQRRALLLAALESMSDATLRYKRLETIREVLRRDWGGCG